MFSLSGKKILLSIHILLISIWIGTLIAILLLLLVKQTQFNIGSFPALDKTVFLLFDSIIIKDSIAVAITGLLFSMFTTWGFFRFNWITIKWVSIVGLALIIMFLQGPVVNGMASLSDVFLQEVRNNPDYLKFEHRTIIYTLIQLCLLTFIVFISVLKPWGQRKARKVLNRKLVLSIGISLGIILAASSIMQYLQLVHYRNLPINEINLNQINDGYYTGTASFGFEYEVGVQIENHTIAEIDILKNRDSFYARQAEGIKYKLIREQKINIDAVTGATTTSKVLLKAVESALSR
jgi:uncharacterized protein with FMN-binding domain